MWAKRVDWEMVTIFGLMILGNKVSHELFARWPCLLTEFLAPIRESIWEESKCVFWPCLLLGELQIIRGQWSRGQQKIISLLLVVGNVIVKCLLLSCELLGQGSGRAAEIIMLGTACAAALWIHQKEGYEKWINVLIAVLLFLYVMWTVYPPEGVIWNKYLRMGAEVVRISKVST